MHLTPIEHLENRRPKCKMPTQERQLTRFFCILQLIYKENRTEQTVFQNRTKPKPNQTRSFFSKPNQTWKIHSAHP